MKDPVRGEQLDDQTHPQPSAARLLSRRQGHVLDAALAACWATLMLTVLVTSVEQNAIMPSRQLRYIVQAFSPQGWAFFTRDPREAWHHTFTIDERNRLQPADVADYRGAPWRGVDRTLRNRGIMTEQVAAQVPKDAWQPCRDTPRLCLMDYQGPVVEAVLSANDTTGLCGRLLIQEASTVPWAWRTSYQRVSNPSRIVVVNVRCTNAKGQPQ